MSHTEEPTTEQLVTEAVQGSREALEEILRRIQNRVYAIALRMLFHPADAEDATQEILIKVITNLKGFRFEGPFMAWVMRIAANHLKTTRKSWAEKKELNMEKAHEVIDRAEAMGWFSKPLEAPEPLMEIEMRSACTQALLLALDRAHRMAFVLGVVMDVSGPEGAYILDISPVAFRKRLSRARTRVKDFLSANCGLFDDSNRCQCVGIMSGHVARGFVDRGKPLFASPSEDQEDPATLRQYLKELDELGRVSALFKSFPRNESSMDYALLVKEMVENESFRILSDPQRM
ncbi:MAG: RNA polymerase sigma factor [Deltaproteobacteria bacterium]|nr:RNA polymerase sigma factor [Deltaproteobacteria bacterium]